MTEKIMNDLPEILRRHVCTLKNASFDDTNKEYMSDSQLKVINFDKIPSEFSRGKGWPHMPASNDALYISIDGTWYFIEFKNGSIDKSNLYKKIYDSLIMLIESGVIPDFQFARDNICYILVYNSEKYSKVQKSENRIVNYAYILGLAQIEEKLFDVNRFERFLFRETHTYTKEIFKSKFVDCMEDREKMVEGHGEN